MNPSRRRHAILLLIGLLAGACGATSEGGAQAIKSATLEDAVAAIGATCDAPRRQTIPGTDVVSSANPWTLQDCYWDGGHFYLEFPDNWDQTQVVAEQFCSTGMAIPDQVVATDEKSWMATGDSNSATQQLASALSDSGLRLSVRPYCPS